MGKIPTFIYNPGIQVYIEVTDKTTGTTRLLDVTEDLTKGTLTRRVDGVSQFQFTLQNPGRKYDYDPTIKPNGAPRPIFTPMDRIIVNMKRVKWMRVFTGYLDSVPAFQAWPGEVNLQASCSLKRLQYWYWDSTLAASEQLVRNSIFAELTKAQDGGTANVLREVLYNVVNWPMKKVHIGQIPSNWYDFAGDIVAKLVADINAANEAAQAVARASGNTSTVGGVSSSVNVTGALTPGSTVAGQTLDQEQCTNAEIVFQVGKKLGASDEQCAMGICAAMTESRLHNDHFGDRDSLGLFQQRSGWGSVQEREDPVTASKKFFWAFLKNYSSSTSFQMNIQNTQGSAFSDGSNYAVFQQFGLAVTSLLVKADGNSGTQQVGNDPNFNSQLNSTATGTNGGLAQVKNGTVDQNTFLRVALGLPESNPNLTYNELTGSARIAQVKSARPTVLDCSMYVTWVIRNTVGGTGLDPGANTVTLSNWCEGNGGQRITVAKAMLTPGALLFASTNGQASGTHHVAISCGDGLHNTAAHSQSSNPQVGVDAGGASFFSYGYTVPNVTYSNIGGGGGTTIGGAGGGTTVTTAPQNSDPNAVTTDVSSNSKDPIDKLFSGAAWNPTDTSGAADLSNSLFGVRALLNDEPLLPYLINLMHCSMRSLCSAPNGDFMAWFPDYYGIWGTAAVMVIQDVELLNFSMNWSDLEMVTHQFVTEAITSQFNINDGTLTNTGTDPTTFTTGIATIDVKEIMSALFGLTPTAKDEAAFKHFIYARFGARVNYQALQGISGPKGEFFMALFLFMQNWAKQYTATMPTTFMPELWPGMLVQLPSFNFQAYVNSVTHSFQMGEGGYFQTDAEIIAPSRLDGSSPLNFGLPISGNFGPGRTYNHAHDAPPTPKFTGPGSTGGNTTEKVGF